MPDFVEDFAADKDTGVIYAVFYAEGQRSLNRGLSWELLPRRVQHAGFFKGEVFSGYGVWSIDYGNTFHTPSGHGWVPIAGGDADVGVQRGALFVLVYDGALIATFDYGEYYDTINVIPYGGLIRAGA